MQAPPMHQVIALAGVKQTRICGCCMELPLYQIDPSPTQVDRGRELYLVCARCDVSSDRRRS